MRTTTHNGRSKRGGKVYGTKHNDRNFDVTKADNIDPERAHLNELRHCYPGEDLTFEQAELRYYEEHFGEQLRQTNERYKANGHPERCKTMEEWKQARRNAPEESILQIGKMEEHATREQLMACYEVYRERLEDWNQKHGNPFQTLSEALHADEEGAPHIHTRRVWAYKDDAGMERLGQEKALEAAGVELPDPSKPEGRRNNRKMTFDKMARTMWLDVIQEHGIEVEREALPGGRHNREKEEMIRDKYEEMVAGADKALLEAQNATREAEAAQARVYDLEGQTAAMEGQMIILQGRIERTEDAAAAAKAEAEASVAAAEAAAKEAQLKAQQEILDAQAKVFAMQQAYEGQKAYVRKAKELATPEKMFPEYAERTTRGVFRKEEVITVPLEKWEARHIAETDYISIAAQQKALEGLAAKNEQLTHEVTGKAHLAIEIAKQNDQIRELKDENSRLRGFVERALTQIRDGAWKLWKRFVKPAKAQDPKVLDFDDSLKHWQQHDKDIYQEQSAAMPEVRLYQGILGPDQLMAEMMAMDGEGKYAIRKALKERYPQSDVLTETNNKTH